MTKILNISSKTLKKWLDNNEAALIDVREVVENNICAIKGAVNLPLSQVTIDKAILPEHKNKKLVIHCKAGKRSMSACNKLISEGLEEDIWNLEGGIDDWQKENLPIVVKKNILPLERQTHIAISFMILAGIFLYLLMQNQIYLALPLIAGLGLLNSGVTGWCGMARLVAKMPWNR